MSKLDRLTKFRIDNGYKTAKAFAKFLGVSESNISEIDKKDNPATINAALAIKTNINLAWLETGEGSVYRGSEIEVKSLDDIDDDQEIIKVPLYRAEGSCGDGIVNSDEDNYG